MIIHFLRKLENHVICVTYLLNLFVVSFSQPFSMDCILQPYAMITSGKCYSLPLTMLHLIKRFSPFAPNGFVKLFAALVPYHLEK